MYLLIHTCSYSYRQIAGRAGRMNSKFSIGEVTTWQDFDLAYVQAVMSYDVPKIKVVMCMRVCICIYTIIMFLCVYA